VSESASALIFYLSVLALVAGTIRALRAAIERNRRDAVGIAFALVGLVGLALSVVTFLLGPKKMLPF